MSKDRKHSSLNAGTAKDRNHRNDRNDVLELEQNGTEVGSLPCALSPSRMHRVPNDDVATQLHNLMKAPLRLCGREQPIYTYQVIVNVKYLFCA